MPVAIIPPTTRARSTAQKVVAALSSVDGAPSGKGAVVGFDGDFSRLKQAFVEFLHHLPFYGLAVVCIDDDEVRSMLADVTRPVIRYGIDFDADVCASNIRYQGSKTTFDVMLPDADATIEITLNMPGRHNVLNALAAICVGFELGVSSEHMQSALAKFQGIGRRMHMYGEAKIKQGLVSIVDDYAHHPTEVAASLKPGGIFLLEGYTPKQLSKKTGGQPVKELMYSSIY